MGIDMVNTALVVVLLIVLALMIGVMGKAIDGADTGKGKAAPQAKIAPPPQKSAPIAAIAAAAIEQYRKDGH